MPQRYHMRGFSNDVTLGKLGEIRQNSAPVMHIRKQRDEGFLDIRWRENSLTQFDGKRWFNPPGGGEDIPVFDRNVTLKPEHTPRRYEWITYQVQLGEMSLDSLVYAGMVQRVIVNAPLLHYTPGGLLRVSGVSTNGLKYLAASVVEHELATPLVPPDPLPPVERIQLLQLPGKLDARISLLAHEVTEGGSNDGVKAASIQKYLSRNYGYTLHLLPAPVPDPLANFLFERKKGHCEYFASAMAVMLRTVGIPSRVVTGFTSGVFNPLTGWQVVRASDAHSWVEAWIAGRGWMTYDPTPPDPNALTSAFMTRVSLFFDAADQFWQDWVLGYDQERQFVLASHMQQSGRGAKLHWLESAISWLAEASRSSVSYAPAAAVSIFAAIAGVLFGPSAWRSWRGAMRVRRLKRGEGAASDATLLYQRMLRLLERRGIQKPPWLTPLEFARVLPPTEVSPLVDDLTSAYVEFRFGGKRDAAPRMVRLLDQLEKM